LPDARQIFPSRRQPEISRRFDGDAEQLHANFLIFKSADFEKCSGHLVLQPRTEADKAKLINNKNPTFEVNF